MNWPHGSDLDSALDYLLAKAADWDSRTRGPLPFQPGGYTQSEIDQHSEALGRPIPTDIAAMYQRLRGIQREDAMSDEHELTLFLYALPDSRWITPSEETELDWLQEKYPGWFAADYFAFGQGIFGDALVYCPNPPERSAGSIILLDHEGMGPEESPMQPCTVVFLADNLPQWMARWTACDFIEYGYLSGEIPGLTSKLGPVIRADHERLNPGIRIVD